MSTRRDAAVPAPIPAPFPGRPLYVLCEGGRVYVSAHDWYHRHTVRAFKQKIRTIHPDVNHQRGATGHTRHLLCTRARWEQAERMWYAQFGLDPPGGQRRIRRDDACGSQEAGGCGLPTHPALSNQN